MVIWSDKKHRVRKNMPIVCFEGPSAAGKTTTSAAFAGKYSAFVVPEVNKLFTRPSPEPEDWYFQRQVERWTIASRKLRDYEIVILDGDPFQPFWYNWCYPNSDWKSIDWLAGFYRPQLERGNLDFPALYVIFSAPENVLRERKEGDKTRSRNGFEAHLKFISPQRKYFDFLNSVSRGSVAVLETLGIEKNIFRIKEMCQPAPDSGSVSSLELFDQFISWLKTNSAQKFVEQGAAGNSRQPGS
jgi:thymidylate kinase